MKTPKFLSKLSAVLTPRPKKRLQATARAARRPMDDYDEEEPTTKLSSAFVVVLILHVVAVGGIYAFNSIKASRKEREAVTEVSAPAAPVPAKVAQNDPPAAASSTVHQSTPTQAVDPAPIPPLNAGSGRTYTVKAGDNLTKIAFAYSVTPSEIIHANHIKDTTVLRAGQVLTIPEAKTTSKSETHTTPKQSNVAPTATTPGFYTVKKGDTATSIAHNFGLTTEELLKANRITEPKKLQPGQTLKVPPRKS
ncbi:MAG TPA: LysM peptidoglycan-binding domain-containing protein [Chthoniobacter sp.]|jgi:LysM repeat protein